MAKRFALMISLVSIVRSGSAVQCDLLHIEKICHSYFIE